VSKPCCPVCWELLSTLRDDGPHDFLVDGYHKTLSQVELPPWLPLDIVGKLTQKFEGYLLIQIETLMENNRRRAIIPSGQSALDFGSDSSDGEEDSERCLKYRGETGFKTVLEKAGKLRRQPNLRHGSGKQMRPPL